jgi:hypothetical protein
MTSANEFIDLNQRIAARNATFALPIEFASATDDSKCSACKKNAPGGAKVGFALLL